MKKNQHFENFQIFSSDFGNFEIFEKFYILKFSETKISKTKKKFIQILFSDLDYVSRVPENHLEHSTTRSEGDTGRVRGSFFVIFHDFLDFSSILTKKLHFPDGPGRSAGKSFTSITFESLHLRDY